MAELLDADNLFYMMGDEDTDVSVFCRGCDDSGMPIIFYTADERITAYHSGEVKVVHTVVDFFREAQIHYKKHF